VSVIQHLLAEAGHERGAGPFKTPRLQDYKTSKLQYRRFQIRMEIYEDDSSSLLKNPHMGKLKKTR